MWHYFSENKKIVFSILVGIIIIGFSLYSTGSFSSKISLKRIVDNERESITLNELIEKDADGDGIMDWEELLWGTNPNNKDTNGDGVSDKIEIEKKRSTLNTEPTAENKNTPQKANETDLLARQLFSATFSLKQSGELNEITEKTLSQGLVNNLSTGDISIYKESDLKIVGDTKDSFNKYSISIGEMVKKYNQYQLGSELSIISRALQTNDSSLMEDLEKIAENYDLLAKEVIKMGVPKEISLSHLDLANSYHGIAVALQKISTLFKDPVIGFTGLAEYRLSEQKATLSIEKIETYFAYNVIIFNKKSH